MSVFIAPLHASNKYLMQSYTELLGSKFPIIAAPMNKVSDLKLAFAVYEAGAVPSLSIYNYYHIPLESAQTASFITDVIRFRNRVKSMNILLSIGDKHLMNPVFTDALIRCKVKLIELAPDETLVTSTAWPAILDKVAYLKENGITVFLKILADEITPEIDFGAIAGIIVKGHEAAGRISKTTTPLTELTRQFKLYFPNLHIIPAGGVGSSAQLKELIECGATAVSIGTMFAAAEESLVSRETKLKMIEATKDDVNVLPNGETQNGILFGKIDDEWDSNNTKSLKDGILSPKKGHIFVGKGINHVTEILPVKTVVENLMKDII